MIEVDVYPKGIGMSILADLIGMNGDMCTLNEHTHLLLNKHFPVYIPMCAKNIGIKDIWALCKNRDIYAGPFLMELWEKWGYMSIIQRTLEWAFQQTYRIIRWEWALQWF